MFHYFFLITPEVKLNLKRSVGQREECACGGAGQGSLLHIHVPPQACYSRCSMIHPVGDHGYQSYFHQNQKPVIRMERSTDFLG
ncbi:MAG: hypothetical protein P8179_01660 [Candidatus Thiodiazotropha sp.]